MGVESKMTCGCRTLCEDNIKEEVRWYLEYLYVVWKAADQSLLFTSELNETASGRN